MENIIGKKTKHKDNYSYLSLHDFPSKDFKTAIDDILIRKANNAQFLLGKLSGITLLLPNLDFFINSYMMKDAAASSQIEGTQATMLDAFEYSADPMNARDNDADDITHYLAALNYGLTRLKDENFPLSLRFIRELHEKLMSKARSTHFSDPGEFRKSQNWIGGTLPSNASFVPPTPEELPKALNDLERFIHNPFLHPILDAGLLHAQFETIHPFLDGNGRTGRLLIIFYLIENKYLDVPALFLSSYFMKYKKIYYERLDNYHNGDVFSWLDFFIDGVINTAEEAIEIATEITKQRNIDLELISSFTKKTSDTAMIILNELYKNPIVSSSSIQKWIGQTRQGTNSFINILMNAGLISLFRKGKGSKPSLYIHSKYIMIFYDKHVQIED